MGIAWALGRIPKKESKEPNRMLRKEADVEAHIEWLKKKEAVYFDHMWSCNADELDVPINGYLYIPELRAIAYRLKIDEIISSDNPLILRNRIQREYIPPWREQCYTGKWSKSNLYTPNEPHERSITWILVSKICKLSPCITNSQEMIKWNDRKPLESFIPPLRSRVYIVDENWKYKKSV